MLGDRYELLEPIGRGGMATIYRARDQRMGRLVAVKILREMYSSDPKFVLRFQREARAVSALAHPNIVQVFDYGKSEDQYYIVMELIEGVDLRKYLRANGILDLRRAVVIAHDVALALGAAHRRGIVHRDVKPQNILVNDEALVKLTDFGIATFYRDVNSERLTTTGMTLGTVQYYAPEQAQGEVVQPAADVYALGVVLYEMLVGHPPFDGDTPVAIAVRHIQEPPVRPSRYNPNIPPTLERVILRCLEKDPRDRYRDGDALAYALETFDKPRNSASSGRVSTPMGAAGAPSSGAFAAGSGRSPSGPPRLASGPMNRYDAEPGFGQGPTRAEFAPGTMPRTATDLPTPYDDEEKPAPAVGITTAVIVASILVLLGVACFVSLNVLHVFGGGPTPTAIQKIGVPKFIGLNINDAGALATKDNLVAAVKYVPVTDSTQNGIVLDQMPAADAQVQIGTTITLTVGQAANTKITIPNILGEPLDTAKADLVKAGFSTNNIVLAGTIASASFQQGDVAQINPEVGTVVTPNTTIYLYTSSGAPTAAVTSTPAATATTGATAVPTTGVTPTVTPTKSPTATPPPPTATP